jgi:hypothetical protein
MNLRGLANSATRRANPNQTITWKRATGVITQDAAYARTPQYETVVLEAQVQAIDGEGLRRAEVLGISGIMRTVFIYGNMHGIVRTDMKGGDLLSFPELPGEADKSWKIFDQVMNWSGWSSAHVVLQPNDGNY